MREGREIRFLFLPDGHDPDSLVGEEGREAFETRISRAQPLSEYFIKRLGEQIDINSIDSRSRLVTLARPLLERIPPGIFLDLLRHKVAEFLRVSTERLIELLEQDRANVSAVPAPRTNVNSSIGSHSEAEDTPARYGTTARTTVTPTPHGSVQVGRRNLVRQAIHLLVHYPEIADKVALNPALATLDRPGVPLLIELVEELGRRPCANTGVLLERWRERPDLKHLRTLSLQDCLVDSNGAARDLAGALRQLGDEAVQLRTDFLLKKVGLTEAEKAELQGLLARRAPVEPGASTRT